MNQQVAVPEVGCDGAQSLAGCSGFERTCLFDICTQPYVIFGDMNQQGALSEPDCDSSQNGRGGLFFVVPDAQLFNSVRDLLQGQTAPQ